MSGVVRLARRGVNRQLPANLKKSVWARCSSYFRAPDGPVGTEWPYTGTEYAKSTWRLMACWTGGQLLRDERATK